MLVHSLPQSIRDQVVLHIKDVCYRNVLSNAKKIWPRNPYFSACVAKAKVEDTGSYHVNIERHNAMGGIDIVTYREITRHCLLQMQSGHKNTKSYCPSAVHLSTPGGGRAKCCLP